MTKILGLNGRPISTGKGKGKSKVKVNEEDMKIFTHALAKCKSMIEKIDAMKADFEKAKEESPDNLMIQNIINLLDEIRNA